MREYRWTKVRQRWARIGWQIKVKVKVTRLKFNCRNLNLFLCSFILIIIFFYIFNCNLHNIKHCILYIHQAKIGHFTLNVLRQAVWIFGTSMRVTLFGATEMRIHWGENCPSYRKFISIRCLYIVENGRRKINRSIAGHFGPESKRTSRTTVDRGELSILKTR